MDYTLILQNISRHISLTAKEQAVFKGMLEELVLPKKAVLLHENEICRASAFVVSGCLRGYTIDSNGFEHILQFAPPDWWIADMYSLITQQPGHLVIDALEDSEVLLLPKKEQEKLYTRIPKFERFFRIITENSLVTNRQRLLDNLSMSAQERYAQFCKRYPTLIEKIPQKQVAAYIGVTPEFLSKLKASWLKKNR